MKKDTIHSTIYVGLCDMDTGMQKYDTEKYMSILKKNKAETFQGCTVSTPEANRSIHPLTSHIVTS